MGFSGSAQGTCGEGCIAAGCFLCVCVCVSLPIVSACVVRNGCVVSANGWADGLAVVHPPVVVMARYFVVVAGVIVMVWAW